ncbi:MAG: Ig-like domain-containing protein [Pseudomonadota bacterium]
MFPIRLTKQFLVALSMVFLSSITCFLPEARGQGPTGDQTILVVLFKQTGYATSMTQSQVESIVFGEINNYYREVSYGKMSISGAVYGWYELPNDPCVSTKPFWDRFALDNVDRSQFSRTLVVHAGQTCPTNSAIAMVGDVLGGPIAWVPDAMFGFSVPAHELGHTFGLGHSNTMDCQGLPIISGAPLLCTIGYYHDYVDPMSNVFTKGFLNAGHIAREGWFNAGNLVTVAGSPGQTFDYALEPLEINSYNLKALMIPRNASDSFVVEYRQPLGTDMSLSGDVFSGAFIHMTWFGSTLVIDSASPDYLEPFTWHPGQTFTDPATNTSISVLSRTAAALNVRVTMGTPDLNPPDAIVTAPTEGQVVSGTITLGADVVNRVNGVILAPDIMRVQFRDTYGQMNATASGPPYTATFDTTRNYSNGIHYVYVLAWDNAGNVRQSPSVRIDVENTDTTPPTVTFQLPYEGGYNQNPVTIQVLAQDPNYNGISKIELYDNDITTPFFVSTDGSARINTQATLAPEMNHRITAKAYDGAGNMGSVSVTIFVSNLAPNQLPSVSLSATPGSGGAVTFSASAGDSDGTIQSCNLDFGDGSASVSCGNAISHTYAQGSYQACASATDDRGGQGSACKPVSVNSKLRVRISSPKGWGAPRRLSLLDPVNMCSTVIEALDDASEPATGALIRLDDSGPLDSRVERSFAPSTEFSSSVSWQLDQLQFAVRVERDCSITLLSASDPSAVEIVNDGEGSGMQGISVSGGCAVPDGSAAEGIWDLILIAAFFAIRRRDQNLAD